MNKRLLLALPLFIALSAYSSEEQDKKKEAALSEKCTEKSSLVSSEKAENSQSTRNSTGLVFRVVQESDKEKEIELSFEKCMKEAETTHKEWLKSNQSIAQTKALETRRSLFEFMKINMTYGETLVTHAESTPAENPKLVLLNQQIHRIQNQTLHITNFLLSNRLYGERYSPDELALLGTLKIQLDALTMQIKE